MTIIPSRCLLAPEQPAIVFCWWPPIPYNNGGSFHLVCSGTPAASGLSDFSVMTTDENCVSEAAITVVTVNAFDNTNAGKGNPSGTGVWREVWR